jgi:hypothetical protein
VPFVDVLRATVAAKVEHHGAAALGKEGPLPLEEAAAHPDAVDEDDRGTGPRFLVVKHGAVYGQLGHAGLLAGCGCSASEARKLPLDKSEEAYTVAGYEERTQKTLI